tara:strand:- start:2031 stop:3779 length:1749 start_codon:yes stop_codon:yes gene_type:complete
MSKPTITGDTSNVNVNNADLRVSQDVFANAFFNISGNEIGATPTLDDVITSGGTTTQSVTVGSLSMGSNKVSITSTADSIAIGKSAGSSSQSASSAIAIGDSAGKNNQGAFTIGIGDSAGMISQGQGALAIGGRQTGMTSQGQFAVAIGYGTGRDTQNNYALAFGYDSGKNGQGANAVAMGKSTGKQGQATGAVAIGASAANINQGQYAVALGGSAGLNTQGQRAIAIGSGSGMMSQNSYAISIGTDAGRQGQGESSIAIGREAGYQGQHDNTVIISATGSEVNSSNTSATYITPIRAVSYMSNILGYTSEYEVTVPTNAGIAGDITANAYFDHSGNLVGVAQDIDSVLTEGNSTALSLTVGALTSSANVDGVNSYLSGTVTAGTLVVSSGSTTVGTLSASGAGTFGSSLAVNGSGNALTVANNAVISGQMRAVSGLIDTTLQVTGDLIVSGNVTSIESTNLIVDDPIVEFGRTNTNSGAVIDVGMVFRQPSGNSNVATFFSGADSKYYIGYTSNSGSDSGLIVTGSLPVHINGSLTTTGGASVGADLSVTSNVSTSNATCSGIFSMGSGNIRIEGNSIVFG